MNNFYGQSGEDEIAWQLFKDDSLPGVFLDVGAHNGITFSNTLAFEQRGWRGICIEPHPELFQQLKVNRPNSFCLNVAAGVREEKGVKFWMTPGGHFSSVSEEDIEALKAKYPPGEFENIREISVPLMSLDYALMVGAAGRLDYLSLDVEGQEMQALLGFSIRRWKPRLVIVENNDEWEMLLAYFKRAGYKLARVVYQNMLFCRDEADVEIISSYVLAPRENE